MLAEVRRSGYYAWLARTDSVSLLKERDYAVYLFLKCIDDRHSSWSLQGDA